MSDIWIRKIKTFFQRCDFDKDGEIHRKDFQRMAERYGDLEKFSPEEVEISRKRFDDVFSHYTKASGNKDVLTVDVMIESMKTQRDDPAMKKAIRDMLLSLFDAIGLNSDGYIDFEEFRRAFESVGIVESGFARAAFDQIDVNHDKKLSLDEYIKAFTDYLCSDDENTTAMFGLLF